MYERYKGPFVSNFRISSLHEFYNGMIVLFNHKSHVILSGRGDILTILKKQIYFLKKLTPNPWLKGGGRKRGGKGQNGTGTVEFLFKIQLDLQFCAESKYII